MVKYLLRLNILGGPRGLPAPTCQRDWRLCSAAAQAITSVQGSELVGDPAGEAGAAQMANKHGDAQRH